MQIEQECLNRAMFIASESYSGSFYDLTLSQAMDDECDDVSAIAFSEPETTIIVMAA
jgi:hypothetical protein